MIRLRKPINVFTFYQATWYVTASYCYLTILAPAKLQLRKLLGWHLGTSGSPDFGVCIAALLSAIWYLPATYLTFIADLLCCNNACLLVVIDDTLVHLVLLMQEVIRPNSLIS